MPALLLATATLLLILPVVPESVSDHRRVDSVYEFDNGVRILKSHLVAAQMFRYQRNPVKLHEPHEEEWFVSLIFGATKGSIFLDVGAAAGYYCLLALRLRPNMAVVAINPSVYFRNALVQNAALQATSVSVALSGEDTLARPAEGTILQLPVAVAAQSGRITIDSKYGSGIQMNKSAASHDDVPALTLSQVLAICSRPVHLAMFDVQGEEAHIFASDQVGLQLAAHTIRRFMVGIHGGAPTMHIVRTALIRAGYEVLVERLSAPAQPDGVLIAIAPNISSPLTRLGRVSGNARGSPALEVQV
jgi:FkbM family methyltransferase